MTEAVRAAFAGQFALIPDVRYTDDTHFVAGDRGLSEWLLSRYRLTGSASKCVAATSGGDKIVVKNAFWKIRTS